MAGKQLTAEQKAALAALRERMGGVSSAKREHERAARTVRAAICQRLAAGPGSVPDIAAAIGAPPHEVLWHLTAMRKYGQAGEVGQENGYPHYALLDAAASPATH